MMITEVTISDGIVSLETSGNEPCDEIAISFLPNFESEGEGQLIILPRWKFELLVSSLNKNETNH